MKRGIESFIQSVVKQGGGPSASNLYEFSLQPSPAMMEFFDTNLNRAGTGALPGYRGGDSGGLSVLQNGLHKMQLLCNEIQIPGTTFASYDVRMPQKGITQKMISSKVFNELDVSFYLDSESLPLTFFRAWQDFAMGIRESPASDRDPEGLYSPNRSWDLYKHEAYAQRYYNDYACDLVIAKLEKTKIENREYEDDRLAFTMRMSSAYPYMVSSIPYSAGPAELVKVSVGFYYEYSHLAFGKSIPNN